MVTDLSVKAGSARAVLAAGAEAAVLDSADWPAAARELSAPVLLLP